MRCRTDQLTSIANANASFASDYDAGGRLVRDQRTVGATTYTATTSYDAGGRVTARTFPDGTGAGPYGYNAAGQQISLAGAITGTTYNAAGAVLTISYANGVATTYGYSPQREWLNMVSTVKGATVLQSATYTRESAGRITGIDGNRTEDDSTRCLTNLSPSLHTHAILPFVRCTTSEIMTSGWCGGDWVGWPSGCSRLKARAACSGSPEKSLARGVAPCRCCQGLEAAKAWAAGGVGCGGPHWVSGHRNPPVSRCGTGCARPDVP